MVFEQPGVKNIRERKAANEARRYREQHEGPDPEPRKGSIEHLIWMARQKMTPEQREELQRKSAERCAAMEKEMIERHRCGDCGADTLNYSHSFRCPWRGSGF
jgi:hypothetical protein